MANMKRQFELLAFVLVMIFAGSYVWTHLRHASTSLQKPASTAPEVQPKYAEEEEAGQMTAVSGPLADYMARQKPGKIETLHPVAYKPAETDRIGESPVGTSRTILHQTFVITGVADLPFELPAHASTPQLRGTYHAFVQKTDAQAADTEGDVAFMLLSERQYADFLSGRPDEALFSAEGMHDGEVNVSMPPTLDHPVKYHLVFRNASGTAAKQAVQADFRIDF
jgi:hypothetical protein